MPEIKVCDVNQSMNEPGAGGVVGTVVVVPGKTPGAWSCEGGAGMYGEPGVAGVPGNIHTVPSGALATGTGTGGTIVGGYMIGLIGTGEGSGAGTTGGEPVG